MPYCNSCNKPISEAVFSYSKKNFGKPLCMTCQQRKREDNSSGKTRRISSNQRPVEQELASEVVSGVSKIMRGVAKVIREMPIKKETDFNSWTADWRRTRKLDFSMESRHFFLAGTDLDDFTKQLIKMSQKTILIANPYLENCYLTDALIDSANNQTQINIVTRMPEMKEIKKTECHSKLRRAGITLRYDSQIHSKIIIVDDKVSIVSSMNFYSGSSGGASKEAGMVSIDDTVVRSTTNYVNSLLNPLFRPLPPPPPP